MGARLTLSVVVTTFHGRGLLERCLRALWAQDPRPDQVVVSSANPNDVVGPVADAFPGFCRVGTSRHLHYAATANRGLARATGSHVVLLNDDTRVLPGFCAALLRAAMEGGEANASGLYQPRILLMNREDRLDNAGHGLFPDGFNMARGRDRADGPTFDRPGTVGSVSGAAFMAPRQVLLDLGGYDEGMGAFGEDADLSFRAVRRGYPIIYVPEARVEHQLGASYGRYGLHKVYLVERNRVRAALRSLPATALILMPALTPARWGIQALAAVRNHGSTVRPGPAAPLAAVAGALAGLAGLPQAWVRRRHDATAWRRGEWAMWRHLLDERVRWRDLG